MNKKLIELIENGKPILGERISPKRILEVVFMERGES